jgi:uncharacterized protein YdhG (YjbR/CyaY superfamily)
MKNYKDVDEYLADFDGDTLKKLVAIRRTIKEIVPRNTTEKISYGMPTYYLNGNLVHFAGYKTHIGFYPGSAPIAEFKDELSGFKISKGTIRFSLKKPIPFDLIRKITAVCLERNQSKKKK